MDKRIFFYMIFLFLTFYVMQKVFTPKKPQIQKEIQTQETPIDQTEKQDFQENYYVIENEYQQIVFSDINGSIVEINLPLSSKNPNSIVRPIEADKEILSQNSRNAYFPQKDYFSYGFETKRPSVGGYYPLLRRSIYDRNGKILHKLNPKYYALNLYSNNNPNENVKFSVKKFEKNLIEFEGTVNGTRVTKTYFFDTKEKVPYILNMKLKVDGPNANLYLSSGVVEVELTSNAFIPTLKYRTLSGNKNVTEKISLPKNINEKYKSYVDWMSSSNGFFGVILDPVEESKNGYISEYIPGKNAPTRLSTIDAKYNLYPTQKYPGYELFLPINKESKESSYRIYAGPYKSQIFKIMDNVYENSITGYYPDYLSVKDSKGWLSFATEPFAKFLFLVMELFYKITKSWGFSIILLTIVFRVMLYPLNSWSIKSTLRMQEITPLLKIIDAKYKKDPQKANMEKIKLFKEKKANPLSGCLPILIQLPFLFGMFNLLKNTFELRGVPFIKGWIDNLTAPDVLFSWNHPIMFIGNSFHLIPILLGIVMFIQSKMNAKGPKDKSKMTDQQKQQLIMGYLLPFVFIFIFYKAASGLTIYFLFSMLLGIIQQWYISKFKKQKNNIKIVK